MLAFAQPNNLIDFPQPQGKSNEWYTPARYIEAAREVMGSIDLDPASCELANRTVKATRFYSAKENGLARAWYGNVWLNPPYGRLSGTGGTKSYQLLFVERLVNRYEQGNVKQGILLLLGNAMYKQWFPILWDYPICIHPTSIAFKRPERTRHDTDRLGFGSIFVYLGPHEQTFIDVFSKFGTIAKRVSQPRQTVTPLSLWEVAP